MGFCSVRAVAARTGVPRWPRGAVCPQGVPFYELVMEPRQSAYNRILTLQNFARKICRFQGCTWGVKMWFCSVRAVAARTGGIGPHGRPEVASGRGMPPGSAMLWAHNGAATASVQ